MLNFRNEILHKYFTNANSGSGYKSVIHLTIGGDNVEYGDRTPGLWVYGGTQLHFGSAIDGNKDYSFTTPAISLNTWYSIEISQLEDGSEVSYI